MQAAHLETYPANGSAQHAGLIRWNAIIAGSLVALALWAMLYTLGIALGLSTLNPDDTSSLKASGIFTGTWSVLSPLIALFCGAMFTSRGAAAPTRGAGAMHGLVMWSLSTIGFAWLFVSLLSGVVGGALGAGKQVLSLGGQGVIASTPGAESLQKVAARAADVMGDNMPFDYQEALGNINDRLKKAGRAPIEPASLSQGLKDLVRKGMNEGKIEREDVIKVILDNTPLERKDAEEVSEQLQKRLDASKEKLQDALAQAKQVATDSAYKTADVTGKAFWGIFTVLFLGMLASVGGGYVGVRDERRVV